MEKETSLRIAEEFESCISRTLERLTDEDTHRPFHSALLPEEALFWSRFERSFSTSFGQRAIEQISKLAAVAGGASDVETQYSTQIHIDRAQLTAIESHVQKLRENSLGRFPVWSLDLEEVLSHAPTGDVVDLRVISDLRWIRNGTEHLMSIKTVKPNIDQTAEAKRDLLKLKVFDPKYEVYFGLYYNPYGENRSQYTWTIPHKVFDMKHDPVVRVGREYWDTLGGEGFYDELLLIAKTSGEKMREKLVRKK